MNIYAIDVHHVTHTCPENPEPHPINTQRRIVHVTPGGPCRAPVTIRIGDTTTTVDCGRHEPQRRQCPACRVVVTMHTVTAEHLGYQGPAELAPTHEASA